MHMNLHPQNHVHSTNLRGLSLRVISRVHDYGSGPVEYLYKCLELEINDLNGDKVRCCRSFKDRETFNKARKALLELYSASKDVKINKLKQLAPSYADAERL